MPHECLAQEPFGGSEVSPLAEPELNRVAIAVDSPVQVHPSPADFDKCLIDMPLSGNGSLASMKLLQQQRRVMDGPAVYSSVIDGDAALGHHLLKISESQIVSQIPPHTEQNHRSIKMPALKHLFLRH
jgi:hypothetical protein